MKGVNLKKIGAILAGTALLAGSVAFAGQTMFENVELVNAQGAPVAKVVVGSNADLSDALGAAKIAQTLANNAFVEKTYKAEVEGLDALQVDGGQATAEVTDESVTLEVVVPGVQSTAVHEFGLLIGERTDTDLGDRDDTKDGLNITSDLLGEEANPFQDQNGGLLSVDAATYDYLAYPIDSSNLGAFEPISIGDATEYQRVYLDATTGFNDDEIQLKGNSMVYQVVFGPSEQGLELCPGDTSKDLGTCDSTDDISSVRHELYLFGKKYVVTDLVFTSGSTVSPSFSTDSTVALPGTGDFILKVAEEAVYDPSLDVGSSLETPEGYRVQLDDISRNDAAGNPAIMTVYGPDGDAIESIQVTPGDTEEVDVGGGEKLKIHVYDTAPGYTLGAKWAEVAIIKNEIQLENGKDFLDYDKDNFGDSRYKVYFGLVDKNGGATNNINYATHLKEILFVATDSEFFSENGFLQEGDMLKVSDLTGFEGYELTYNGLEDVDTDSLRFDVKTSTTFKTDIYDPATDTVLYNDVEIGPYIQATSGGDNFRFSSRKSDKLVYGISNLTLTNTIDVNIDTEEDTSGGAENITIDNVIITSANATVLLLKRSDGGYYFVSSPSLATDVSTDPLDWTGDNTKNCGASDILSSINDAAIDPAQSITSVDYRPAGSDSGAISDTVTPPDVVNVVGDVTFASYSSGADCFVNVTVTNPVVADLTSQWDITEEVGEVSSADATATISFQYDDSQDQFEGLAGDQDDEITYTPPAGLPSDVFGYNGGEEKENFITLRGTEYTTGDDDTRSFTVAKQVRKAMLRFAPTEAASQAVNAVTVGPLKEGETADVGGGVSVTVKSIDQTVTVSGAGAGSVDTTGVRAVIVSEDGTEKMDTLTAVTRVPVQDSLVVLDSEAANVGTKIVVGGPAVNSVAADVFDSAGLELTQDNPVLVTAVDEKTVVVAGYTAENTATAVDQFLAQLS